MSYQYHLEDLLALIHAQAPTQVNAVTINRRRVENGLLSVGVKLHFLDEVSALHQLLERLGGVERIINVNRYKQARASLCWVLPPVGSARVAVHFLEAIELATKYPLFNNPRVQIQVCSPKRLSGENAALLSIAFYLGSDLLRRYELGDFATTFSSDVDHARGKRITLYDAGGQFDAGFAWWGSKNGKLQILPCIPQPHDRTDILTATSKRDIATINLVATLLVHAEKKGYWATQGVQFRNDMLAMLERHMLGGVVRAPWVRTNEPHTYKDAAFYSALSELMLYAHGEAERISRLREISRKLLFGSRTPHGDILHEMQTILQTHRSAIVREVARLEQGEKE